MEVAFFYVYSRAFVAVNSEFCLMDKITTLTKFNEVDVSSGGTTETVKKSWSHESEEQRLLVLFNDFFFPEVT